VIFIRATKNQGKHPKPRSVVVFEGNPLIRVRHLLANHIEFRRSQDATDTDSHGQMAASHLSATCWIAC
jgi:hypothetical protein